MRSVGVVTKESSSKQTSYAQDAKSCKVQSLRTASRAASCTRRRCRISSSRARSRWACRCATRRSFSSRARSFSSRCACSRSSLRVREASSPDSIAGRSHRRRVLSQVPPRAQRLSSIDAPSAVCVTGYQGLLAGESQRSFGLLLRLCFYALQGSAVEGSSVKVTWTESKVLCSIM